MMVMMIMMIIMIIIIIGRGMDSIGLEERNIRDKDRLGLGGVGN